MHINDTQGVCGVSRFVIQRHLCVSFRCCGAENETEILIVDRNETIDGRDPGFVMGSGTVNGIDHFVSLYTVSYRIYINIILYYLNLITRLTRPANR